MTNTSALDEILGLRGAPGKPVKDSSARPGPAYSADTQGISRVCRIVADEDGAVAAVTRWNLHTGRWWIELLRLGAGAEPCAVLILRDAPDAAARRIATAMSASDSADLVLTPGGGAVALGPRGLGLAMAAGALARGREACVTAAEGWCALHDPTTQEVHLIKDGKAPKPRTVDTEALDLGGWRRLTCLHIANGWLYAAVADPVSGFDLCRCKLSARAHRFERLLTRGAHRFALNAAVTSMAVCRQGLLLGTAALAGTAQPVGDWGPEILLVTPDGGWDMLAGEPRFSPDGLMLPAAMGTLDLRSSRNSAVMAIAHADGLTAIAVQDFAGAPQEDRSKIVVDVFDYHGRVRLLVSRDLSDWQEVEHDLPDIPGPVTCLGLSAGGVWVGLESPYEDFRPLHFAALR